MVENFIGKVQNIHCASCKLYIENYFTKQEGIKDIYVNIATKEISISYDTHFFSKKQIEKSFKKIGYPIEKQNTFKDKNLFEKKRLYFVFTLLFIEIILMLPIFSFDTYLFMCLLTLMIVGSSLKMLWYGIKALYSFHPSMDSLMAMAVLMAFVGEISRFLGFPVSSFLMIISMLICFNLLGKFLEEKAKQKTFNAMDSLYKLLPKNALKIDEDNKNTKIVAIDTLQKGDKVRILVGEKIPLDGVVCNGTTKTNEAMLTGEANLVLKKENDKVFAGTINELSAIDIKVLGQVKDTFLSSLVNSIEKSQLEKVPIQNTANKVIMYFVPSVLFIAFFTFFFFCFFPNTSHWIHFLAKYLFFIPLNMSVFSFALQTSISILVVACPCALGLAIPTALMVASGKAAENGIIVKHLNSMQYLKYITHIVLDKTGTLTKGNLDITDIFTNGESEKEALQIVASIEQYSTHPLAKSFKKSFEKKGGSYLPVKEVKNLIGKGLTATIDGKIYTVGSENLVKKDLFFKEKFQLLQKEGKTIVFLTKDQKIIALFALKDTLKQDAKSFISFMKEKHIDVTLLSGDEKRAAMEVAKALDIQYEAKLLPEEKAKKVKKLQEKGCRVLMVGDGMNDAIALKQADVSIVMDSGSDLSKNVGDIIILNNNLESIQKIYILSQKTFSVIQRNLFAAFFYNSLFIPLAILGIIHPLFAEIAMVLSSLSVIFNSLRIQKMRLG